METFTEPRGPRGKLKEVCLPWERERLGNVRTEKKSKNAEAWATTEEVYKKTFKFLL